MKTLTFEDSLKILINHIGNSNGSQIAFTHTHTDLIK